MKVAVFISSLGHYRAYAVCAETAETLTVHDDAGRQSCRSRSSASFIGSSGLTPEELNIRFADFARSVRARRIAIDQEERAGYAALLPTAPATERFTHD